MDLAAAVKCLASVKDLNKDLLLAAWEKGCPSPEEKNKDQELSYKDLVSQYKKSQSVQRLGGQSSKAVKARAQSVHYFSLNFSTYRRKLSSFSKTSPNVQVIGFTENDSYIDVLRRVSGLSIHMIVLLNFILQCIEIFRISSGKEDSVREVSPKECTVLYTHQSLMLETKCVAVLLLLAVLVFGG